MSRAIPIIQIDAVYEHQQQHQQQQPQHHQPPNNYAKSNKHAEHIYATPQPQLDPWNVQHMAVPSDNYSARSSAFNSTRSDQPDADDAIPDDEFFATTPTHLATPTRDAPPVHTTVTTATLYNASTGIRADPHERKRSVCRIVLLVLLLLAFVTVAVLSYLTFVDTSITVLIWGLCMIPIGLFLLTCWCACWPATAVEKRISACFKRNCCHLNC